MVASEVGALLGWRLHTSKVNMALTLALTSVIGGILASLLPVVYLIAVLNGLMGAVLLFSGFRRLPRSVRIMGGAGFGLFLAALPYLTTQFGGELIAGIIFIGVLALLDVGHAVIVLCVLMGCVGGALGHMLGALLGGAGSSWSLALGILGGLAGLGANLIVFVSQKKLFPGRSLFPSRDREGAVATDKPLADPRGSDTARAERVALWPALVALAALLAVLSACWIIPLRLGVGANASFYRFGFCSDEYQYAERCEPLVTGATMTNPYSGLGDANVVSQLYLEDSLRALLTFTGLDSIYFYWIWRFAFPLLFFGAIGLLAHECLPKGGVMRWRLWLAASAAIFISVYVFNDLLNDLLVTKSINFHPLYGWLNRIPTNFEYLLAALLAWAFIRLVKECNLRNGLILAILSAVIIYERIFAAVPWGLAIFLGVLILLALGRLKIPVGLAMLTALAVLLSLWMERYLHNKDLPVWAEQWARIGFRQDYAVHPLLWFYLKIAAGFIAAILLLGRRWWPLTISATATMAALPYISGLFPFNIQVLYMDRYGVFYLLLTHLLVLLVLCKYINFNRVGKWPLVFSLLAVCGAAATGVRNTKVDFNIGPNDGINPDLVYLPAYKWVRENTPAGALFLVEYYHDWSIANDTTFHGLQPWFQFSRDDLFQIVAKRRRLCHWANNDYTALSNKDCADIWDLQLDTFAVNCDKDSYLKRLRAWRPDYMFWRKSKEYPPVLSGWGPRLAPYCEKVYEDPVALIWKLTPAAFSF